MPGGPRCAGAMASGEEGGLGGIEKRVWLQGAPLRKQPVIWSCIPGHRVNLTLVPMVISTLGASARNQAQARGKCVSFHPSPLTTNPSWELVSSGDGVQGLGSPKPGSVSVPAAGARVWGRVPAQLLEWKEVLSRQGEWSKSPTGQSHPPDRVKGIFWM